jgi:hypothetical protein
VVLSYCDNLRGYIFLFIERLVLCGRGVFY